GIKLDATGHKGSGGGTIANLNYACRMSTLGVGSVSAINIDAAALALSRISERMGVNIDAILGHSFLKKRIVQFDYLQSVVRFLDRSPASSGSSKAVTLPFRYKDNVLIDG